MAMRSIERHLAAAIGVGLLLLGGAAAVVLPAVSRADVERTRGRLVDVAEAARAIRGAGDRCPSARDLVAERIYADEPTDGWGRRVEIRCEGDRVVAVSAGPDGRADTRDDIRR